MTAPSRRFLPLFTRVGGRSPKTCQYRCGNACSHPAPNTSDNQYFGNLVDAVTSRRGLLRAGALGALVIGAGVVAEPAEPAHAAPHHPPGKPPGTPPGPPPRGTTPVTGPLTFKPIPPNTLDTVIVPNGYGQSVVLAWGDPILPGAPAFDIDRQSASAQAKQFGYNNDWLTTLPLDPKGNRLLLVVNHEYTNEELMFRGFTSMENLTVEQLRIAMAAHGMSVVEIARVDGSGQWRPAVKGATYNRRITPSTPMRFTGPAAGSRLLRTAADPSGREVLGTLNNCAGGLTPWGTVLSGEENFHQYFVGGDGVPADAKPALARYGINTATRYPSGSRRWDRVDPRFDLTAHPHEANRFGWVVEVDPYDPRSTPRKHTALGRFKHEGAEVILSRDGRAVVYMGDDERFDYLYKFVSDKKMRTGTSDSARRHNMTLLESGTLYVARFSFTSADEIDGSGRLPSDGAFDGVGEWIPLVKGTTSLVPGMSVDEVLVHTRLAADKVGATKMDRPEDVSPNPKTGKVYAALTNNSRRGAAGYPGPDEANPRSNNRHGHIVEITEDGGDNAATTFRWAIPIVCGDPDDPSTYFAGFDKSKVSPISCPDNLDVDADGNLWISTDGNALGSHDGLFVVPVEGPERGYVRQFLTVPTGAEQASAVLSDDNRTVFVSVQHPGEVEGSTVDTPASTWPYGDVGRPGVVCVWRYDGRHIGA